MAGGDTLIVGAGTYDEIITDLAGTGGYAVRPPSGSSWDAPTILKAENPGSVTVLVSSPPEGWPSVVEFDSNSSYIVLDGFVLDGQFVRDPVLGLAAPAQRLRFKDLEIKNAGGSGIQGDGTAFEFLNLHIHHSAWRATNDTACTRSSCPTTCGVQTNFCYQTPDLYAWAKCHGFCHAFYVRGSDHLIDGGRFHDNDDHGVQWYASNSIIRNALIYNNPNPGIGAYGGGNTIYNNVLVNNGMGVVMGPGQTVMQNTIYGHATGGKYGIYQKPGTASTIKNNLILQQDVDPAYRGYIFIDDGAGNNALLQSVPSQIAGNLCDDTTMVGCAPVPTSPSIVINAGAMDFHLCSGSPAIAAGVPLPDAAMRLDKDGVARPSTGAVDIGAYQYVSGGPTFPAPSNLRVMKVQ